MTMTNKELLAQFKQRLDAVSQNESFNEKIAEKLRQIYNIIDNAIAVSTGARLDDRERLEPLLWENLITALKNTIAIIGQDEKPISTEADPNKVGYSSDVIKKSEAFSGEAKLRTELQAILETISQERPKLQSDVKVTRLEF